MSYSGGNCNCGTGGSGIKMYPDVEKAATTPIMIEGVTQGKMVSEESEKSFAAEGGHTCKCGPNCTCNPCNC